jgi:hypothetical protein
MKYDRFDHEQQIMQCWALCEDLKVLSEGVLERNLSSDQIANVLLGMEQLYQLKFEKLFEQLEQSIRENK